MRVTAQGSSANSFTIMNETVDGLYLAVTATAIADVTIPYLETITVKASLYRDGSTTQVLAGNAFALGQSNNPGSYEGIAIGGTAGYKSFFIPFGGPINLKGTDSLTCEVAVGTAATGQVTILSSHNAIGVEFFTPQVNVMPIDKTRNNISLQLGNNVTQVSVVNTGTAFIVTDINANSKLWKCNVSLAEQFCLLAEQWNRAPEFYALTVFHSPSDPADSFNCDCVINTGASGNCYVVSYGGHVSQTVKNRAAQLTNRIATEKVNKYL